MFETVSFHIVKPCNMKCKFCYATFDDMHVSMLLKHEATGIISKLADAGVQKITFAGGEPLIYPHIKDVIRHAKRIGLTTSIITNGSLLSEQFLYEMKPDLDWIGISVDSLNPLTNNLIGRTHQDYYNLIKRIKKLDYMLKINTVVNAMNWKENMQSFIDFAQPLRWKLFQALKVQGQNDEHFEAMKISKQQFEFFIDNHKFPNMVIEDNELMTGSYLLIDPQGRMFENSKGTHTYSESVYQQTVDKCLSQINLNRTNFEKRGGIYKWQKQKQ